MSTGSLSDAEIFSLYETYESFGGDAVKGAIRLGAEKLGIPESTFRTRIKIGKKRGIIASPEFRDAAKAGNVSNPNNISHMWKIAKDDAGNGYSLFVKNPDLDKDDISIEDMVRNAIEQSFADGPLKYPKRDFKSDIHGRLLIIDLADVHFLKLCVKTEVGVEYNRNVARHRVVEGTRALLHRASHENICRILFILGNDILHTDDIIPRTTNGTPQDTEGTIFQGFSDAKRALVDAIELCAEMAPVDLIHTMSNHDRKMGWTLSQTLAAWFRNHPHVKTTEYNMSESPVKFYRFEKNLYGIAHADGAKEEKLYGMMVTGAREHISNTSNLYWLLHHFHHKDRKTRDGFKSYLREKDHNGMTAIMKGHTIWESEHVDIEYVRSPSPPDSWHFLNGYINRQGVESFIYDPIDGQIARYTEWF